MTMCFMINLCMFLTLYFKDQDRKRPGRWIYKQDTHYRGTDKCTTMLCMHVALVRKGGYSSVFLKTLNNIMSSIDSHTP